MSELKKLTKAVDKAKEVVEARRLDVETAIANWGTAVAAHAVALEAFEQAEAMEKAKALRSAK